jgi:hypothetical protein
LKLPRAVMVGAAAATLAGAILYAELVQDWRTQRSDQIARYAMTVTFSMSLIDYNEFEAETEHHYGKGISSSLDLSTGEIRVTRDGTLIETRTHQKSLEGARGILVVGQNNSLTARFPVDIQFDSDSVGASLPNVLFLKKRFKTMPQAWFEFEDKDWMIDRCANLPPGFGLGYFGKALGLRQGQACVISGKQQQGDSLLIVGGRANGDPWMRPFGRRLCRTMVDTALERFKSDDAKGPKYAACILADRPDYVSARKSLVVSVYVVGTRNGLARMEPPAN